MKLGHAFRLANRYANVDNAKRFAQHVVPEVVRPARIIWNQAIGAIFLLFALLFFGNSVRYYRTLSTESPSSVGLIFSLFLGLLMALFAITSFRRARRISRL